MNEKQENQQTQPGLSINAQYIKDLSFETPLMPQILGDMKQAPQVDIKVDVNAAKLNDNGMYTVDLKFNIETKSGDKVLFLCELDYGSVVTLNLPEEHIEPVLLIEVPRYLFPFARNIVADVTRESSLPPLMIAPIDFVDLYRRRKGINPESASENPENKSVN
ncbi:MAG: Protein-export protein SecB [Alphaproteobacteria bacterium ADurb.Bin438]|nr:MAG: Protein-export protein SecB [Alphaproteobacteria bacterium ADurb.Bin438]